MTSSPLYTARIQHSNTLFLRSYREVGTLNTGLKPPIIAMNPFASPNIMPKAMTRTANETNKT